MNKKINLNHTKNNIKFYSKIEIIGLNLLYTVLVLNLIIQIDSDNNFIKMTIIPNENSPKILSVFNHNKPSRILLNGTVLNNSNITKKELEIYHNETNSKLNNYYIDIGEHNIQNIIIEWNNTIDSMFAMFRECDFIISIDFSNFNISFVKEMSYMFSKCYSLQYLELSNFNTSNVIDMKFMFFGCYSLISLDVSSFNTSNVIDMKNMFSFYFYEEDEEFDIFSISEPELSLLFILEQIEIFSSQKDILISLDLSNFDTSSVMDMSGMFFGFFYLKSLNINKFNTSFVQDMRFMFSYCISLISLNISNFDTSLVTEMTGMFAGCTSLISLELSSNFISTNVRTTAYMFSRCYYLISLDLSSFNPSLIVISRFMLSYCKNLEFINLTNFCLNYDRLEEEEYYLDMFILTQDFLVYCKNDQISDIYDLSVDVVKNQLLSKRCSIENCSTNWKSKKKKSVVDSNLCVDNCSSISYYEYNNQCYKNCPEGTNSSEKDLYLCEIIPKKVEKET